MSMKASGQKVLKQLNEAGYVAYFVGGMVRDTLLGRNSYDVDITTAAPPEMVLTLFDKTFATGLQHGTVTVLMDHENIEVTTFRLDGDYLDHRHPDEVVYTHSLSADLGRRDFTINAMAQGLDEKIIDPFNGQLDLAAGVIRAVGIPKKRFEEDALRILRGVRFVAKLGFDIETETLQGMKACRHLLSSLSLERIRKEFEGILEEKKHRQKALDMMVQNKLLEYLPFFSVLLKFESLGKIKQMATLLNVIAFELQEIQTFLTTFPLTKKEKKMIQTLLVIDNERWDERLIIYRFGADIHHQRYLLDCFYQNEELAYNCPSIKINGLADLVIQPAELIERLKRPPGPWVSNIFIEIEEAVVLEEIENTRAAILKLVEKRGILNVEKD